MGRCFVWTWGTAAQDAHIIAIPTTIFGGTSLETSTDNIATQTTLRELVEGLQSTEISHSGCQQQMKTNTFGHHTMIKNLSAVLRRVSSE